MIKQQTQKPKPKPIHCNYPFLINNKNIVIKRGFDIIAQSNISISNIGRIAICQPTACIIVDLVDQIKTRHRVIPILAGDAYHWVYSWNDGFIIIGDINTQFIDYNYDLTNLNDVIGRFYYFPTTQDIYVVETDISLTTHQQCKYFRNYKNPKQTRQLIPLKPKQKLRGKLNLLDPEFTIEHDDKTVQSYSFCYNPGTKEKEIILFPEQTLNYLKLDSDTVIYLTHADGSNTLNIKDIKTDEVTQVTKIARPNSFSFTSINQQHNLVSIQDGYKIKLINYKTKTIADLQDLFPKCLRKGDCQVMSGDMKYFVILKKDEGRLFLNCYSFYNEKKAKIHLFTTSYLRERFGKALLDTMLLKI